MCCQVNCQFGFWYNMVKLISSDSSVECLCCGVLIIIVKCECGWYFRRVLDDGVNRDNCVQLIESD